MKRCTLLAFVIVLLTSTVYPATQVQQDEHSSPLRVAHRTETPQGFRFDLAIDSPMWTHIGEELDEAVDVVEYSTAGAIEREGFPAVPVIGRMFRIPPTTGVVVEVLNAEYETYEDVDYANFASEAEVIELERAEQPRDVWFPGTLAEAAPPAILRDFRVSNLLVYPVQVNQARREVRIYHDLEIDIRFEGEDLRNALPHNPIQISEAYLPWYRLFLDWNDAELDEYTLYRGSVQVIMQNNQTLRNYLAPWIEWKRQKGWQLEYLTNSDVAWNATSIKNELQRRWDASETKFDYIVIIGDNRGSYPTPAAATEGDHDYGLMAGGDDLIDVAIGRISVESNTDVQVYVNKVIAYERDPNMQNTGWYHRAQIAYSSNNSGSSPVYVGRYQRHALLALGYTQVDTAWAAPYGTGNVNNLSINRINAGVSYYGARGFISAGLTVNQINALTNSFMTPVCLDITCGTGNWARMGETGINEAYMRAGTVNSPRGGIGGFGTATSSTHTRFDNSLLGGSAFSMLVLRNRAMGDMIMGAKINIWNNFYGYDATVYDYNEWYNLMGDPTVWVWTDIPHTFNVQSEATIELGTNSYPVFVREGQTPIEGAWVTLYRSDQNEEVIARGETDRNGRVILNAPFRYSGEAMLTITNQNFAPYRQTVNIVTPNQRVGYVSISYQDNGADGTVGNNNGVPEAGETVGLRVTAKNWGASLRSNVTASASTLDPWIIDVTGQVTFGNLMANQQLQGTGLILVQIAPEVQDDWIAHLTLDFSTDIGTFSDDYSLTIAAPQFAFVSLSGATGFDPGETTNITIRIKNVGGSRAEASTGVLTSLDPHLTILQNTATFAAMNVGVSATSTSFQIQAAAQTFDGHVARNRLVITSATGQVDSLFVNVTIGTRASNDPAGPDSYGYYAYENTDTGYELAPTFDWIEINPAIGGRDFNGNRLNIVDAGDDDDFYSGAEVIDLPFPIQYYGALFTQATVCSNGFIAMGSQGDMRNMRNFTIPSPLGPNYMIAPYWDERRISGQSGVFSYYDAPNGRFIVEWYQARDFQGSNPCTFEVIFFEQAEHPTITGDDEFLFQYSTMTHTMGSQDDTGADVYYWTTGIENGTQTGGLLLSYWNVRSPGVSTITSGRAILFSTNTSILPGNIQGTVTDANTGEPIEGARISTEDAPRGALSHNDGSYSLHAELDHEIVVYCEASGYATQRAYVFANMPEPAIRNFAMYPVVRGIINGLVVDQNDDPVSGATVTVVGSLLAPITTNNNGEFALLLDNGRAYTLMAVYGNQSGSANILVEDDNEYEVDITIGVQAAQVSGPDNYRYIAIQNRDTHPMAPEFDWIEIDPLAGGNGTRDDLMDDEEHPVVIDLPFIFMFYGVEYNQITANENGFFCFGDLSEMDPDEAADYSNTAIPDPDGPPAIVAPFWEDFRSSETHISHYYLEAEDKFVIEWYDSRQYPAQGTRETFEVVLYDPAVYETPTGDGMILFQYLDANDLGNSTVGIENDLETDGIQICYFAVNGDGDWAATAFEIVDESAILFYRSGAIIEGTVTLVPPGDRTSITVASGGLTTNCDAQGHYQMTNLPEGAVELTISAPGYETMIVPLVVSGLDHLEDVDLELWSIRPPVNVTGTQVGQQFQLSWEPPFNPGLTTEMNNLTPDAQSLTPELDEFLSVYRIYRNGSLLNQTDELSYLDTPPIDEVSIYWVSALYSGGESDTSNHVLYDPNAVAETMTLPLQGNYFELISFYIEPANLASGEIFGDIQNLAIVYNDVGNIFLPPLINTIGNIVLSEGYQIFCLAPSQLVVEGWLIDPQIEYSLSGRRWNWMGYPYNFQVPVTTALSEIVDVIQIVTNDAGAIWIPGVVNTMGNMVPGVGYMVFATENVTFQYNSGQMYAVDPVPEIQILPNIEGTPAPTGLPFPILVTIGDDFQTLQPGVVEVYDGDLLVGKAAVLEEYGITPVIAWGGSSEYHLPGFSSGNPISIRLLDGKGALIPAVAQGDQPLVFGSAPYISVILDPVPLPAEFDVQPGYPNPFNPSITVPFALPEQGEVRFSIFNLLGQQVYRMSQQYEAGYHRFVFNTMQNGIDLGSGVYFLQVQHQDQVRIQKLMLLK